MLQSALISVSVGILIFVVWHRWFLHFNRRLATRVLRWLEGALAAHGQISGVEWITPRTFARGSGYPGAPSVNPSWMCVWRRARCLSGGRCGVGADGRKRLLLRVISTCPPRLNMEIGRTRCTGLTRRWMRNTGDWPTHTVASLFISSQPEWEPEISGRMTSVVSTREFKFLEVSFRPRPPQFSVTFSLKETLQASERRAGNLR